MPVIISSQKSQFEISHFDVAPATIQVSKKDLDAFLGQSSLFSDDDLRDISGAPSGATIQFQVVDPWPPAGADRPSPGGYFFISHPTMIKGHNVIGICLDKVKMKYFVYIKDVFFTGAPTGLAALAFAKIVRFCLKYNFDRVELLAAGGRSWPDIINKQTGQSLGRWGGYYFWARCGFDMPLDPSDLSLITHFPHPPRLGACQNVAAVVKDKDGLEWWKVCGNGSFMTFDCSNANTSSMRALEDYLLVKGI